ncbi:MATE family efflux transporter [Brevibacillus humidisoli]|uniref:MATE family efflux transporter n=1 Tax=Brevibacillus humidisoli TaxID=2895522 RepID=UPI001E31B548|nr:MATE family efflux transporter [Brevibacillus humidisoli]UFJ39503.1 MATE family efflux transporter [Brevibacillus humidisoli]
MSATAAKLREAPIGKLFFAYLLPSVLGMLLMSVNIVIDGIFIGHGVGPNGLAGVNIAVPAFSIFISISLWIGIGGATLYSISLGENKQREAQSIFSQACTLAILLIGVIMIICLFNIEPLALLLGANQVILPYALDYLSILLMYGIVFVFQNILSIFVRNDGNPNLSMASLIVTAILNVILDYVYIFVWGWGVAGAAYAIVQATGIGFIVLLTHFFRRNRTLRWVPVRFDGHTIKRILTIGFPSFVAEIAIAIVTIAMNLAFMRMIGEIGVASYSILNYLHSLMLLVFLGVGSALQPLASFHYGARLYDRLKRCMRLAVITALGLGLFFLGTGWLFAGPLVALFDVTSEELYQLTVNGLSLFFLNYLFLGYNLVYATYFQSVGYIPVALIITIGRGILLVLLFLWLLPDWLGLNGIWLSVPAAEALTALMIFLFGRLRRSVPDPMV